MKRRTAPQTNAAARNTAEKETKANKLIKSFKDFASIPAGQNNYRDQADEALTLHFDEMPLPHDWHNIANALHDAGVFEEIAERHKVDDTFYLELDLRPKMKPGGPVLGLIFWLYINEFLNEEGTKAQSVAFGSGEPITARQAAGYYMESNVYRNGEPTVQDMDAKARSAQHAIARRKRAEEARQGSTPKATATQQNSPQHNPEPIDDETIIGSIAQTVDAALETATELFNQDKNREATKLLRDTYTNAKAEMLEAGRQGLAREHTVQSFIENLGCLIAEAKEYATA